MKKRFKKWKENVIVWFDSLVIKRFQKIALNYTTSKQLAITITEVIKYDKEYKPQIIAMYKYIAEKELVLSTELKPIKKGKDKYHVIACKDKNSKTVFNFSRHGSNGSITAMEPSIHIRKL